MEKPRIDKDAWKSSAIGLTVTMLSVIVFLVSLYIITSLVKFVIG